MDDSLVRLERVAATAILTLDRPDKRNALNRAAVAALGARLAAAVADETSRVILLTGTGPAFCAGLDLDEQNETLLGPGARDRMQHDARQLAAVYRALATSPKPTIAVVNGPAVAGGAGLVTACDLAVAAPTARFGYPEVRRGILPAMIAPLLVRTVSYRVAKRLLLVGDLIEADEAARLGVYHGVVDAGALRRTALEWATEIARGGPATIAGTKRWLDRSAGLEDLWMESADASAVARLTPECQEGLRAFREKRAPHWGPPAPGTDPAAT
jgi:methylglutaconyl-CoA hydratase